MIWTTVCHVSAFWSVFQFSRQQTPSECDLFMFSYVCCSLVTKMLLVNNTAVEQPVTLIIKSWEIHKGFWIMHIYMEKAFKCNTSVSAHLSLSQRLRNVHKCSKWQIKWKTGTECLSNVGRPPKELQSTLALIVQVFIKPFSDPSSPVDGGTIGVKKKMPLSG